MNNSSLANRLAAHLMIFIIVATIIISFGFAMLFSSRVDTLNDRSLQGQAQDIAKRILSDPKTGALALDLPEELQRAYYFSSGQYLYMVTDPSGKVLLSSSERSVPLFPAFPGKEAHSQYFSFTDPKTGWPYNGYAIGVSRQGRGYTVQVAQGPIHPDVRIDDFFIEMWDNFALTSLGAAGLLIVGGYVIVRAALRPLTRTAQEVAGIDPAAIHLRLSEKGIPEEILTLVRAVNSALERIEKGYRIQGEFTANAAHELRTPIAIIKANIETLPPIAAQGSLLDDVAHLERMVTQLLRLAQVDNSQLRHNTYADLQEVAAGAAAMFAPQAIRDGKSISVSGVIGPLMVRGDGDYLQIALRNLVENALAHSPKGGCVDIHLDRNACISVSDEGPSVKAKDHGRLFERFWRGDRSGKVQGAGLGLAIVARIVELHGGRIEVSDAPGGGANFAIHLLPA